MCRCSAWRASFDAPPAAAPRNSPAALTQVTAVALYARQMTLREPGPFEPLTPSERAADVADARMSAPDAMSLDADAGNGGGADTRPAEMTAEEEELALYGAVARRRAAHRPLLRRRRDDCQGGTSGGDGAGGGARERAQAERSDALFVCDACVGPARSVRGAEHAAGVCDAAFHAWTAAGAPRYSQRGDACRRRHDAGAARQRAARDAPARSVAVGDDGDVYLLALADSGDLLMYRVFRCVVEARADASLLPFRLARVEHGFIRALARTTTAAAPAASSALDTRVLHVRPMGNVSGIECVVVGGARPVWLMQVRGALRAHPLFLGHNERGGAAFAAFHHRNCRHGFVYYEPQSEQLHLCRLQTDTISYELQLAIRKVPVHATPHSVVYDRGSGLYVVAVSQIAPGAHDWRERDGAAANAARARVDAVVEAGERGGDADAAAAAAEYEDMPLDFDEPGGVPLLDTKFELRLLNPSNWETMDRYVLEEAEHVLSMRVCRLKHNESRSLRAYVVVGTGYSRGEDEMSTGRILIFEILMPHMLLRSVSVRPEKAPISAVVDVCGHLLACAGLKVNGFDFADGSTLVPCAFIDLEFFIVSADSIKNYVVLGDAINSVHFFRWRDTREKGRHLIELSRDNNALRVTNTSFVVDEPSLAMAAFDELGHLQMFEYQPHHGQRSGVPRRDRRRHAGAVHGARALQSRRNAARAAATHRERRRQDRAGHRRRVAARATVRVLWHARRLARRRDAAGRVDVSPTAHGARPAAAERAVGGRRDAGVAAQVALVKFNEPSTDRLRTLDGDALAQFAELEVSTQRELARRCGTTSKQVMNNLIELETTIDLL
jgi:hypothetical protein